MRSRLARLVVGAVFEDAVAGSVRMLTATVLAGLAAACAVSDTGSPSEPAAATPTAADSGAAIVASGPNEIRSGLALDKCLTVAGDGAAGARTELWPCDGRSSQRFLVQPSGEIHSGELCLDAASGMGASGDAIVVWTCHGGQNQQWTLTDHGQLVGIRGKCIDVSAAVPADGQPIVLWDCHGGLNQTWELRADHGTPGPSPPTTPPADDCAVVRDHEPHAMPSVPKPEYLRSIIDPNYGTTITRITGNPGDRIPVADGAWGTRSRHNYSKDQPWNADETLLELKQVSGVRGSMFLDGATYEPLFTRVAPPGAVETRWHPTDASTMLYLTRNGSVGRWNPRTDAAEIIFPLSGFRNATLGWEGNSSADGRWLAVMATREDDGHSVAFALDLVDRSKSVDIDLAEHGVISADWVGISATGTYIVVNGAWAGAALCCGGAMDATKVFTRDGVEVGPFWSEYGVPSHYDLQVDQSGNEVAVGVAKTGPNAGRVVMRRLDSGDLTVLTTGGYAAHSSGRNTRRPGWAYVSHNDHDGLWTWPPYNNEVFAVKLDGSHTIERLGNVHSLRGDYDAETHAVPSPDGRRVLFASDWDGGAGAPIQAYVIDVRPLCR